MRGFSIDAASRLALAQRLFDDKLKQGCLKRLIKREILSLFTSCIGEDAGKSFKVSYKMMHCDAEERGFTRTEVLK